MYDDFVYVKLRRSDASRLGELARLLMDMDATRVMGGIADQLGAALANDTEEVLDPLIVRVLQLVTEGQIANTPPPTKRAGRVVEFYATYDEIREALWNADCRFTTRTFGRKFGRLMRESMWGVMETGNRRKGQLVYHFSDPRY